MKTDIQKNLKIVLPRILKQALEDEYFAEDLAQTLESFLDMVAEQDGFGTERQCDPRGDYRSAFWSLLDVVQPNK